jgi:phosphoribosylglycinamide formyltransferase-1
VKAGPRVVLLAGEGRSTNIVFHYLASRFDVVGAVLERPVPRRRFLRNRVRRLGAGRVAGQVAFRLTVAPLLERQGRGRRGEILRVFSLHDGPIERSLVTRVRSANAEETVAVLRALRPDAIVINGTRILSERLLASVPAPFVNIHAGITPMYRGVHGGYWALVEGDRQACGVTVHLVDAGIDTGPILGQTLIEPTADDTFATYPLLQLAKGLPLLERGVRVAAAGGSNASPPRSDPRSALWTHPTLWEYLRYRIGRGVK